MALKITVLKNEIIDKNLFLFSSKNKFLTSSRIHFVAVTIMNKTAKFQDNLKKTFWDILLTDLHISGPKRGLKRGLVGPENYFSYFSRFMTQCDHIKPKVGLESQYLKEKVEMGGVRGVPFNNSLIRVLSLISKLTSGISAFSVGKQSISINFCSISQISIFF